MGALFWATFRATRSWRYVIVGNREGVPYRVWCVSDGRAGIERQTVAVANALSELIPIEASVVHLNPGPPQVWLPPSLWPLPLAALPSQQRARLRLPWPDIWIGNGRRVIAYSLRTKSLSKGATFVVQLQNPKCDLAGFDLVVPPLHDRVSGANVVSTLGAPVWFTDTQIAQAKAQFSHLATQDTTKVLVVLGGPSKRHRFPHDKAQDIMRAVSALVQQGMSVFITTSRRTPPDIVVMFRAFAHTWGASFFGDEAQDGPNPYLAWLTYADVVLVTEDSTNMITDAAFFGLPIHLLKLEGGDAKFDQLHTAFIDAGAARWFHGKLEQWTYPPVRDALRVAEAIVARLTNAAT
jgi:uncharacterized protein